MAEVTVTLGDKTFAELGLRLRPDYQRPVAPTTRDNTMTIPGKHGAWDFGAYVEPLPFALPCMLIEQDEAALQAAIDAVSAHLFDASGRPRTLKLVFSDSPEKYYNARYSGSLSVSRTLGIGEFTLPLTAFDPFSYAPATAYDPTETYYYDTGLQYDSGLMYDNPPGFEWKYRKQYIGLYNYSGVETPVKFVVRGSVINPRITNRTTGKTLTIGKQVNEYLEVDAERYYAKSSDTEKTGTYFFSTTYPATFVESVKDEYLIAEQYGDFCFLAPGKNSLLLEGGLPNATVEVVWLHKFM